MDKINFLRLNRQLLSVLAVVFLAATLLSGCAGNSKTAAKNSETPKEKYPTKDMKIIVQTGVGGGTDLFARTVVDIIKKNNLVSVPIMVENMQGGSGAVALEYLKNKKMGDNYTLFAIPGGGILSNVSRGVISWDDFHQVAIMGLDQRMLTVAASSKYQNIEQVVEAAKKAPKKLSVGVVAIGGASHLATALLENKAGIEFTVIPFKSGGEAITNLLGGNVDLVFEGMETIGELHRGGKVRPLAVASDKRLESLPDVPTLKEKGIQVEYQLARGFAMMRGVSEDAALYWEDVLKKVTQTPEWKDYAVKTNMESRFLAGKDADKLYRAQYADLVPVFEKLKLTEKK